MITKDVDGTRWVYFNFQAHICVCVCACVRVNLCVCVRACVYTRNFNGSLTKLSVVQTMQFRPIRRSLKNELAGMYVEAVRINFT